MRAHRTKHSQLSPEARAKANCRSYTNVLQRRGQLEEGPCERCGQPAENHHDDYTNPRQIKRLCRDCHLSEHLEGAHA